MIRRVVVSLSLVLGLPILLVSQPRSGDSAPRVQSTAPREAEQFAFLVGHWEVTVTPKVSSLAARIHGSPTYLGTWKAWPALSTKRSFA